METNNKMYKEVRKCSEYRTVYEFVELNAKGERILFEFTKCENPGGKNALPVLWKESGYIDKIIETWWHVSTYVYEQSGKCCVRYNPQVKPGTHKLDFRYILEATEENKDLLINEIAKRAFVE